MKCDACKEREATVHDSSIRAGKIVERHLCEGCARRAGIATTSEPLDPDLISELLIGPSTSGGEAGAGAGAGGAGSGGAGSSARDPSRAEPKPPSRCPRCDLSFAVFRQGGLLGCPECYHTFESQLAPMLQRYHEGGGHHVGKVPRRAGSTPALPPPAPPPLPARPVVPASSVSDLAKRIAVLRGQLAVAIQNEQYERAAQMRDELRRLGDPNLRGGGGEGGGGEQGGGERDPRRPAPDDPAGGGPSR